jgi:hypothetical protein
LPLAVAGLIFFVTLLSNTFNMFISPYPDDVPRLVTTEQNIEHEFEQHLEEYFAIDPVQEIVSPYGIINPMIGYTKYSRNGVVNFIIPAYRNH